MCEVINLTNAIVERGPTVNLRSSKRKDKPRSILVGCPSNSSECPLRAVSTSRTVYYAYHASNFEVGTDEETLCNYLCKYAPSSKMEKLISRQPLRYNTFKITVLKEEAEHILHT